MAVDAAAVEVRGFGHAVATPDVEAVDEL